MDRLEKAEMPENISFINYVFKMDEPEKATIMNILQYTVLAIIPLIVVLKGIKNYIPETDEDKGSLVIIAEIFAQLSVMFVSLYFIHRMICFIPTYSEVKYGDINLINVILAILMISLTINTKLGEKVEVLLDRLYDLYEGQTAQKPVHDKPSGQVRVTQPLSQPHMGLGGNPNNMLPENLQPQMTNLKSETNEQSLQAGHQQSPNFQDMYTGPTASQNSAVPTMMEPMAANDMGGFGSPF
tara:strand:- start:264 stop:986 length:723 start_codon:yes stop_codon:yes gene_type:complete